METNNLAALPETLAKLQPRRKVSKLDDVLGEQWESISTSLTSGLSKRQIHEVLVQQFGIEMSYSTFSVWCRKQLAKMALAAN